jgi:uncharacterized protein YdhG (YjbR/CyaY superfamily)
VKKPQTARHRSASRRKAPFTVDDYFTRLSEPARSRLSKMRAAIWSVVPHKATEVISYQMPAFKHNGVLVWYAAFTDHCSVFPGGSVLEAFKGELTEFKTSKGTVQFPIDKPMPLALIKRIVKARVAEMDEKKVGTR